MKGKLATFLFVMEVASTVCGVIAGAGQVYNQVNYMIKTSKASKAKKAAIENEFTEVGNDVTDFTDVEVDVDVNNVVTE